MKKKACKKCKRLLDEEDKKCPFGRPDCNFDNNAQFSTVWQGRIYFLNVKKSRIAKEMGVDAEGEYAIKVR